MKSLLILWQQMAADAAIQCRTSASRDIKRVARRAEHEGSELFTLSLPEIGKAFERSLDQGQVTDDLLSTCGAKAGFPVFLQSFLLLVFRRDGGLLLDDPLPEAIQAVRQLTLSFSKILLPCSQAREEKAFESFIQCEQELRDSRFALTSADCREYERIGSMLFGNLFNHLDRKVRDGEIIPKHGPGATADKLRGNAKFKQSTWTARLESVFPAMENLIPSLRYHESLDELQFLDPGEEIPVRVISVPKTAKTPRIIAIEPTCMQYMQQGLMEEFVSYAERSRDPFGAPNILQHFMGFTDQTPNQRMACDGSSNGDLATLDLSEASDRVSVRLVQSLLMNHGYLLEAVLATRSTRADVPGHGVIPLAKFASMGSALTFPIEECVFLCAIFYAVEKTLNRRLTMHDIQSYIGRVRVYGDDIIVPVDLVQPVVRTLELLGFKVNRDKSFWTGKFRESCGKEYYDGHDVSIFRVRQLLPRHRADVPSVLSTISLRNQSYKAGYWGVARWLDSILERIIPFPNVAETSEVQGRFSYLGYDISQREDSALQRPLVKGVVVRSRIPASVLEDEWALLKCLLKRGETPFADVRHLERQGRPDIVGMKIGWRCPY